MYEVRVFVNQSNYPRECRSFTNINEAYDCASKLYRLYDATDLMGRVAILCDGKLLRTYELS